MLNDTEPLIYIKFWTYKNTVIMKTKQIEEFEKLSVYVFPKSANWHSHISEVRRMDVSVSNRSTDTFLLAENVSLNSTIFQPVSDASWIHFYLFLHLIRLLSKECETSGVNVCRKRIKSSLLESRSLRWNFCRVRTWDITYYMT